MSQPEPPITELQTVTAKARQPGFHTFTSWGWPDFVPGHIDVGIRNNLQEGGELIVFFDKRTRTELVLPLDDLLRLMHELAPKMIEEVEAVRICKLKGYEVRKRPAWKDWLGL